MSWSKVFPEHVAAVERSVVLAGHHFDLCTANLAGDFLEQFEAFCVFVRRISVVSEVTGDDYQFGAMLKAVDRGNRLFEGFGAKRIGRPVEANVSIAQLNE